MVFILLSSKYCLNSYTFFYYLLLNLHSVAHKFYPKIFTSHYIYLSLIINPIKLLPHNFFFTIFKVFKVNNYRAFSGNLYLNFLIYMEAYFYWYSVRFHHFLVLIVLTVLHISSTFIKSTIPKFHSTRFCYSS